MLTPACPRCPDQRLAPVEIPAREGPRRPLGCPSCTGMWLGREDIEAIALALHDLPRVAIEGLGGPSLIPACFGCSGRLYELEVVGVPVDVCPACGGAWLDRGEHEAISPPPGGDADASAAPAARARSERNPYRVTALHAERRGVVDCAGCQRPSRLEECYVWPTGMLCCDCFKLHPTGTAAPGSVRARGFAALLEVVDVVRNLGRSCAVCGGREPSRCGHEPARRTPNTGG